MPVWDLSDLYGGAGDPKLEADLRQADADAQDFAKAYAGKLAGLKGDVLAEAIAAYERIEEVLGRVMSFAQLVFSGDAQDPENGRFYQTMQERVTAISAHLLFFTLELNKLEDAALEAKLGQSKALAHYRPFLRDLRVFRPHQLSDEVEKLLHEKEVTGRSAWNRLFDETIAGMEVKVGEEALNVSGALNKLSDRNRAVRAAAAKGVSAAFGDKARLFTLITNTLAKDKEIIDGWRQYPRPGSSRNRANMVEDEVVDALVSAVVASYPALSHRYYAMKAKWLGLPKLQHWDRNAPLPDEDDSDIPWDAARDRVLAAYNGFSPELGKIGQRFFDAPWIDAALRPGKASGAFAHPTVPSVHPYLLLNYHGKSRDVMTLAHELGHGVHQVLAADQGYLMSGTPLTLAETASVFGEMLTFRAVLDAEKDPKRRRALLAGKVEDMLNTVVRQIAFYRFETLLHDARRNGELSREEIGALWMQVQVESLGPAFEFTPDYEIYWAYIPHFIHSPFYVYAYAFGDCLVNALYGVFQEGSVPDFQNKYLDLLKAGGTLRHKELLAPFGLNAADPAFWHKGLNVISGFIDELERADG
ncbi:M3 family oligoendopeptidase [Pseudoroseomonas wenyumeiae]|uniref:M3 family oligoendopeptidase n=1 Tax=Teichococcus wenyumeiae TaxID=2478470 RepID=A0A3A9JGB3_9PROT|nr:M3 family oligoendopeptidase [Pseudoroseomonas wenyumeiae]RKK05612.1 M3 family oligoendopeptidase [Pseudoroseomonas wenyumeiae]RMI20063.1 M3 family oligoendopeptidase [Pseudoroseomonas wenyumeiae]